MNSLFTASPSDEFARHYMEVIDHINAAAAVKAEILDLRGVVIFRPPISVKVLAEVVGCKVHQIIVELMNLNIFANINQMIEPEIAFKIANGRGWKTQLEQTGRYGTYFLQLRVLPPEIGKCSELKTLLLDNNCLVELPDELMQCRSLEFISLRNNPDLSLPPEIITPRLPNGNAQAVLDYYFARWRGVGRPLNEIRLILVGRGGTGKTSIVERLVWHRFTPFKKETPGVVLTDWTIDGVRDGPVVAHVWDFAGQTITHSMHQFFLSVRAVYIIVLTGRENSEREDAEYWLRLISAYGIDEEGNGPPVIIALNKWFDPGSARARIDRGALKLDYPYIVGFAETDCTSEKSMAELRELLYATIDTLPWRREIFPAEYRWVKERLEQENQDHLPYDAYRDICRDCGVVDEQRQNVLSENLHQLGVALNYRQDNRLRFASVLRPQWLTKNVYKLVRFAERKGGVLRRDLLSIALKKELNPAMRTFLVDLMVLFELAYPLAEERAETHAWLVPHALPDSQPIGLETFLNAGDATRLRYAYRTLPNSIVPRFIVRTHPLIEGDMRWASGVILMLNGARALVRAKYVDREINVIVIGPSDARRELAGLAQRELRFINDQIKGLEPAETTEVAGEWVLVRTLESDEIKQRKTGVGTRAGTIEVDPTTELNEFSLPPARDDSWKPKVFICFSHRDETQRKKLEIYLKVLATHGILYDDWHDGKIQPGEIWDNKIKQKLQDADVILMLLSNQALASQYIHTVEMRAAVERSKIGTVKLVPIILEDCDWKLPYLRDLQALPKYGRPVRDWSPQDKGWKSVSDGLRTLFETLRANRKAL